MRRSSLPLTGAVLLGLLPGLVGAQDSEPLPPPIRVAHADAATTITRDGDVLACEVNAPLIEGDRVRTQAGRVELGLPNGSALFLDERSILDVRRAERLRLVEGRLRLVASDADAPLDLRIDVPGASLASASTTASFVLEAFSSPRGVDLWLRVDGGVVEVQGEAHSTLVRRGEAIALRSDGTPVPASGYALAERQTFDVWVDARLAAYRSAATVADASASYLPEGLRGYSATLSRYGQWEYEPDYGYVWYPTVVVDWRPYWRGRWDRVGYYGWYWIGGDPWAWPTHHYGRWGYRANRWFWIPQRVWAPAWVSWAVGPGYVGWCPLGYNGLPVFGFGVSVTIQGYAAGYYRSGYYGGYDYWRGWTVLPLDRFHARRYAWGRDYVDVRGWNRAQISAFVTQRVPPPGRGGLGVAVPRYDGRASGPSGALGRVAGRDEAVSGGAHAGRTPEGAALSRWPAGATPRPDSPYERARPYATPRGTVRSPQGAVDPESNVTTTPGSRAGRAGARDGLAAAPEASRRSVFPRVRVPNDSEVVTVPAPTPVVPRYAPDSPTSPYERARPYMSPRGRVPAAPEGASAPAPVPVVPRYAPDVPDSPYERARPYMRSPRPRVPDGSTERPMQPTPAWREWRGAQPGDSEAPGRAIPRVDPRSERTGPGGPASRDEAGARSPRPGDSSWWSSSPRSGSVPRVSSDPPRSRRMGDGAERRSAPGHLGGPSARTRVPPTSHPEH